VGEKPFAQSIILFTFGTSTSPETQILRMAKAKKENSKPRADIDFEQELWDAANELRGAVAENQ
jgi:hypothetical protein